jgi:hypothetical protein
MTYVDAKLDVRFGDFLVYPRNLSIGRPFALYDGPGRGVSPDQRTGSP